MTVLDIDVNSSQILDAQDKDIPLYKSRDYSQVLYISGVALKQSKSQGISAINIANLIAPYLATKQYFSVQVIPPGWLHLRLSDSVVAGWLQGMVGGGRGEGEGEWLMIRCSLFNMLMHAVGVWCN